MQKRHTRLDVFMSKFYRLSHILSLVFPFFRHFFFDKSVPELHAGLRKTQSSIPIMMESSFHSFCSLGGLQLLLFMMPNRTFNNFKVSKSVDWRFFYCIKSVDLRIISSKITKYLVGRFPLYRLSLRFKTLKLN